MERVRHFPGNSVQIGWTLLQEQVSDGASTFKFSSLFHFAVGSVRSDEYDPLPDLTFCSIKPAALLTTLDPVTLMRILFRLSHSLWKTSLQSPLTI